MKHWELRLSGSGGQGIITGGIILAEATILDGKNALQTQTYGPEARGGASKAEVIISSEEITFPKVEHCDLLLSLTLHKMDVSYYKSPFEKHKSSFLISLIKSILDDIFDSSEATFPTLSAAIILSTKSTHCSKSSFITK